VRDIGLTGYDEGWMLTVGGNVGSQPRLVRNWQRLNEGQATNDRKDPPVLQDERKKGNG